MVYADGEKMGYVNDAFNWLNINCKGMFPPPSDYLSNVLQWLNTHPDVFSLILLSFLVIPVYYIFRFAPRNSRHTLPQGFFIQVFGTAVLLILNMLYDITAMGWFVLLLGVVMVFFIYKQLFGYGVWGTIWRVVMAFACGFTLLSVLLNTNYAIHLLRINQEDVAQGYFCNIPIALAFFVIILCVSYFISKYTAKQRK